MTETYVRALRQDDLESLLRLYAQLSLNDPPVERARLTATWQRILGDASLHYVGAFAGDALVATCHAVVVPNLTRGARPYAVIENVVTDEAYRQQGHGARAMRALIERCWSLGCYKVQLASGVQRGGAHAFYESLGFRSDKKLAFVLAAP